jgi:hypothetical protein
MSGKLSRSLPQKNLVVSGLTIASAANVVLYFLGHQFGFLLLAVTLLGFGLMLAHSTLLTLPPSLPPRPAAQPCLWRPFVHTCDPKLSIHRQHHGKTVEQHPNVITFVQFKVPAARRGNNGIDPAPDYFW